MINKADTIRLQPTRPALRRQQQRRMSMLIVEHEAANEIASIYELSYNTNDVNTNLLPTPPPTPVVTPIPSPRTFISLQYDPE